MLIKSVVRSVVEKAADLVFKLNAIARSFYRFDGVDDYGALATRAINPDGDNSFEFFSVETANTTILAQNISATIGAREFQLWQGDSMELNLTFGGSTTNLCTVAQGYISGKKYFLTLTGTNFTLASDTAGNVIRSATFTKGAAREPAAQTLIMCRSAGVGSFASFSRGRQYDVKINGTLWPMADRNQTIQLPEPNGLGAELITPAVLENPAVKGSQWTYLGAGRWQLIGDGSLSELSFISIGVQPPQGFLEFEIESITGSLGCTVNNLARGVFNTVGVKRYFYADKNETSSNGAAVLFKRLGGPTSCIIKNISLKPLTVANAAELVTNGNFSAGTAGWLAGSSATFSVTSGQAAVGYVAGQTSRIEQSRTIEAGSYYELTATAVSISGLSSAFLQVLRGAAGSFATIAETSINSAGQLRVIFLAPATDAIVRLRTGDTANSGTIVWDNVSLRKLDSICNPMQLINTTSDRWREIDK